MHRPFHHASDCIIGTTRRGIGTTSQFDDVARTALVARFSVGLQEQNGFRDKTFLPKKKSAVRCLTRRVESAQCGL